MLVRPRWDAANPIVHGFNNESLSWAFWVPGSVLRMPWPIKQAVEPLVLRELTFQWAR